MMYYSSMRSCTMPACHCNAHLKKPALNSNRWTVRKTDAGTTKIMCRLRKRWLADSQESGNTEKIKSVRRTPSGSIDASIAATKRDPSLIMVLKVICEFLPFLGTVLRALIILQTGETFCKCGSRRLWYQTASYADLVVIPARSDSDYTLKFL